MRASPSFRPDSIRSTGIAVGIAVCLVAGCAKPVPSTLDGHLSLPDARHLLVQGETNLPNQAQILVSLQDSDRAGILVQGLPLVGDGRFQALLTLPEGLAGRKVVVRLTFSPAAFDWSHGQVAKVVGSKGQHLSGPWAKTDNELTILQRDLPFALPNEGGNS